MLSSFIFLKLALFLSIQKSCLLLYVSLKCTLLASCMSFWSALCQYLVRALRCTVLDIQFHSWQTFFCCWLVLDVGLVLCHSTVSAFWFFAWVWSWVSLLLSIFNLCFLLVCLSCLNFLLSFLNLLFRWIVFSLSHPCFLFWFSSADGLLFAWTEHSFLGVFMLLCSFVCNVQFINGSRFHASMNRDPMFVNVVCSPFWKHLLSMILLFFSLFALHVLVRVIVSSQLSWKVLGLSLQTFWLCGEYSVCCSQKKNLVVIVGFCHSTSFLIFLVVFLVVWRVWFLSSKVLVAKSMWTTYELLKSLNLFEKTYIIILSVSPCFLVLISVFYAFPCFWKFVFLVGVFFCSVNVADSIVPHFYTFLTHHSNFSLCVFMHLLCLFALLVHIPRILLFSVCTHVYPFSINHVCCAHILCIWVISLLDLTDP